MTGLRRLLNIIKPNIISKVENAMSKALPRALKALES